MYGVRQQVGLFAILVPFHSSACGARCACCRRYFTAAEASSPKCIMEGGWHYCKGLAARYGGDVRAAVTAFNQARRDATWGTQATLHMVEVRGRGAGMTNTLNHYNVSSSVKQLGNHLDLEACIWPYQVSLCHQQTHLSEHALTFISAFRRAML